MPVSRFSSQQVAQAGLPSVDAGPIRVAVEDDSTAMLPMSLWHSQDERRAPREEPGLPEAVSTPSPSDLPQRAVSGWGQLESRSNSELDSSLLARQQVTELAYADTASGLVPQTHPGLLANSGESVGSAGSTAARAGYAEQGASSALESLSEEVSEGAAEWTRDGSPLISLLALLAGIGLAWGLRQAGRRRRR